MPGLVVARLDQCHASLLRRLERRGLSTARLRLRLGHPAGRLLTPGRHPPAFLALSGRQAPPVVLLARRPARHGPRARAVGSAPLRLAHLFPFEQLHGAHEAVEGRKDVDRLNVLRMQAVGFWVKDNLALEPEEMWSEIS